MDVFREIMNLVLDVSALAFIIAFTLAVWGRDVQKATLFVCLAILMKVLTI